MAVQSIGSATRPPARSPRESSLQLEARRTRQGRCQKAQAAPQQGRCAVFDASCILVVGVVSFFWCGARALAQKVRRTLAADGLDGLLQQAAEELTALHPPPFCENVCLGGAGGGGHALEAPMRRAAASARPGGSAKTPEAEAQSFRRMDSFTPGFGSAPSHPIGSVPSHGLWYISIQSVRFHPVGSVPSQARERSRLACARALGRVRRPAVVYDCMTYFFALRSAEKFRGAPSHRGSLRKSLQSIAKIASKPKF